MNNHTEDERIKAFLNSQERLFPEEWGWQKYENGFRRWAYQLAILEKKEEAKTEQEQEEDEIFYPDLIEEFVVDEIGEGNLPSQDEMVKKYELSEIQERLLEEVKALF